MTRTQALIAASIGSLLGVFSTLLPWASAVGVSLAGHQVGDGQLHLGLCLASLIALSIGWVHPIRALPAAAMWLGLGATAVAIYDIVEIQNLATSEISLMAGASITVGAGLYLAVIGTALQSVLSGYLYFQSLREESSSPYVTFSFLSRPYSTRDAINRVLVSGAIIAAVVTPIFIGGRGGDAAEGAGEAFSGLLVELEDLRQQRDADGRSSELDARIQQLEDATRLGYLERDGDASDKGALAPDFRLLDLEGRPQRLSEIGGPIVLNFWASWCEPCIEEMPEFEIVNQELAGRVTFIGINDGESLETAREFADEVTGVSYLVLLDPTKSMTDGPYPLVGRPTTFFIGADGIIKELRVGIVDLETLRGLVGDLIGEDLGAEAEVVPEDYGEATLNILDSARANYAAAAELIGRWRDNPDVLGDPGWQRNIVAQTRVWSDLHEQFVGLSAPGQWDALHQKVLDALAQIANAAGPLVRDAVESESTGGLETAVTLFESFRGIFDLAADNLSGVIETQQ